jgi:hypothetical protein
MKFQVIVVFRDIALCSLVEVDVSEVCVVSIIRAMIMYCYMLGFLGGMTYAPCSISIVTQRFCCVTMSLLHFHSNVTVPVA